MTDPIGRVIAQRVLTGEFLDWDVPLTGASRTRELSGPGGISGRIEPELQHTLAKDGRPLIEEWSTALFVEEDGQLRAGGIVQSVSEDGSALTVEAPGFCSYPTGVPIVSDYIPADFEEPITVFSNLWAHMQGFPDGNIGMTVHPINSVTWNDPTVGRITRPSYQLITGGDGPYKVQGFEYKDYGTELNNISTASSFDYLEQHVWNATHTQIVHTLEVGFPRLGRRRSDLRFTAGENIVSFSPVGADGSQFSNEVHLLGSGEGRDMPAAVNAVRDGRLRRPVVVSRKAADDGLAAIFAAQERTRRELKIDIGEVKVMEHPNAPISAIQPGDDIYTMVDVPWFGDVRLWLRVLSIEESLDEPGRATLKTQRSDYFVYTSDTNPNPDGSPVLITL